MTAERDPVDAIEDILHNIDLARRFVGAVVTVDELEADPKTLYSVVRALEVVGEATKRVPGSIREMDPSIPRTLEVPCSSSSSGSPASCSRSSR